VNERWTYTVIADEPGGTPIELRVSLEDRDADRRATIQVTVAGAQVDVDDKPRDYEAPEWKAKELLLQGGVAETDVYITALKDHLRAALTG
jgi:hypothetical protein